MLLIVICFSYLNTLYNIFHGLHFLFCFLKFFLCFTGECHDHIRGHRAAGEIFLEKGHAFQIPGGIVLPVHSFQHRIAAGLHGKVELGTQVRKLFQFLAEFLRDDPGLQGSQADTHRAGCLADRLQKGGKGTLTLSGETYDLTHTLEEGTLTLTIDGQDATGTYTDGVITVDLFGATCTFEPSAE